jgi:predicted Zn-dependent peptidase
MYSESLVHQNLASTKDEKIMPHIQFAKGSFKLLPVNTVNQSCRIIRDAGIILIMGIFATMKRITAKSVLVSLLMFAGVVKGWAQPDAATLKNQKGLTVGSATTNKYSYQSAPNDPLNARIYKLENGLTVYLSQYKDAPRIQTYIVTRAGSKNDPSDATGLAHYLEHMLFKGTDKFGSLDYAKEKPLLEKIENLYETYRSTKDENKRAAIYREIDSISGVAAKYAIANEYDKMIASIGGSGSNAYTAPDQTVYIAEIPSNQLEKWVIIEAERFRNPVMRIFHTELEAVYEEKNRGLDNDGRKVYENLFAELFKNHTYGTQTAIGTIEHLKNPSIRKIRDYYNQYYVPNNMAICLSGDLDFDVAIRVIDANFGRMQTKEVKPYTFKPETELSSPVQKDVFGPEAESVTIGFRLPGFNSREAEMTELLSKLLYNGNAGLFDTELNQKQQLLEATAYPYIIKDYSIFILSGKARENQSLEEVRNLMLKQLERIARGDFPEWLLDAAKTDMKIERINEFEKNDGRANAFIDAFVNDVEWKEYLERFNRIQKISKADLVVFAAKHFRNNYVAINKRTGEDKNVQKVVKPPITPVEVNRDAQSEFLTTIIGAKVPEIEPVFLNYEADIQQMKDARGQPVYFYTNRSNELFTLFYNWEQGSNHDKKWPLAIEYLDFIGAGNYTAAQFNEELYKIGSKLYFYQDENSIGVKLEGLHENLDKAVALLQLKLTQPKADDAILQSVIESQLKKRADAKLNKRAILWSGMYNYGRYGKNSPFTHILSEKELKAVRSSELIAMIQSLGNYPHEIYAYAPGESIMIKNLMDKYALSNSALKSIPEAARFKQEKVEQTQVYVIDYDMKQAEIVLLSRDDEYNSTIVPRATLFNEYFGGGMQSIVFQTMRESKALAYSVYSNYSMPARKGEFNYTLAYIGTQADKLPEAMTGMLELMNELPNSDNMFYGAKESVIQGLRTQRITKADVLQNYLRAKRLGLNHDIRKDIFENVSRMTFEDINRFHGEKFRNRKFNILVLGKKEFLDIKTLENYGKVSYLKLEDVFNH